MRKVTILFLCAFFLSISSAIELGAEEKVIRFGGPDGWELIPRRIQVIEVQGVRAHTALAISSVPQKDSDGTDLSISFDSLSPSGFFDSQGLYSVQPSPSVGAAGAQRARIGTGTALFSGSAGIAPLDGSISITPLRGALLYPGTRLSDFSVEFWLYPANMENGEQILSWTAGRKTPAGDTTFQSIRAQVSRNRLEWTFSDFFASPDDARRINRSLTSFSNILPRTWSHHLLRFDADTGLLEYVVDGRLEGATYTTLSGREGGDVFSPVAGVGGVLLLGPRFTGMMDEFRLHRQFAPQVSLNKYPPSGGRAESAFLDLGTNNTLIRRLEADTGIGKDNSDIQFFLRAADNPHRWKDDEESWIPIRAGQDLDGRFKGRWAQIRVQFYPDGDGERSPFLDALRLVYEPDLPPPPPSQVTALARDGAVDLSWKPTNDLDLGGYLIYYGKSKGEYFGTDASLGPSPLDVGNRTTLRIDGLDNGVLYYFAIAAYDRADPPHRGDFSREVSARPLRMAP
jgi:hypothetical protein